MNQSPRRPLLATLAALVLLAQSVQQDVLALVAVPVLARPRARSKIRR